MSTDMSALNLKRQVTIKVVVTPRWKDETQQFLQTQINQLDSRLQQLDVQVQRVITEIRKQSIQPPGPEVTQQINDIQAQGNNERSKILEQKNQVLQQLSQVQVLEMGQEVAQGQVDSYFTITKGENLIEKMQVEILLRDGIVEEIRGVL
ncbi:MAG: YlqD family protein [Gloeomargaritaceae cyanobacterium C42_A2020_066]|nr:YlqD family protein [Gloeomargaritaceae cyanobacterium C42_A2020_066]